MRTEYDGKVQFGKLVVNQQFGPENSNSYKAPWPSGAAGTLGVQQELWDRPMTLGEERSIQCLQPIIFQPSTVTLKAIGPAPVVFPGSDEFVSLLEIQSTVTIHANPEMGIPATQLVTTLWADERGDIRKTFSFLSGQSSGSLGVTTYRVDKAVALRGGDDSIDLVRSASVDLPASAVGTIQEIFTNETMGPLRWRLAVIGDAKPLATISGQSLSDNDDGSVDLTVDFRTDSLMESPPTAADLASGPLIDSNHRTIQKYASTIVSLDGDTQMDAAKRVVETAADLIETRPGTLGFASASQAIRRGEGDCTEYAVLTAALMRAKGIPARVAAGMVIVPTTSSSEENADAAGESDGPDVTPAAKTHRLAYHMWNLVYIDGRWVHFDAALMSSGTQQGLAFPNRIALVQSDLAAGGSSAVILPVLSSMSGFRCLDISTP
ncbi:MAG: transglutaminase-like domain-containing protein [Planctomycetota bacterium]